MHPILAHRGRLLPYLAACAPLAVILTGLLARPGAFSVAEAAALAVPLTLAYAFMGLSAWYPCRSLPLKGARLARLSLTHGAAAVLTSTIWVLLGAGLARLLALSPGWEGLPARYAVAVRPLFAAGDPALSALGRPALRAGRLRGGARGRAARSRPGDARPRGGAGGPEGPDPPALSLQQPELDLGAGRERSAAGAADVRAAWPTFCARAFPSAKRRSISMGEELALSRAYLAVEELRFGARLAVEEDLDERGSGCLVPPLLLQPLVENAIRHGIATRLEGGTCASASPAERAGCAS